MVTGVIVRLGYGGPEHEDGALDWLFGGVVRGGLQ
jgi:hypothetical protein